MTHLPLSYATTRRSLLRSAAVLSAFRGTRTLAQTPESTPDQIPIQSTTPGEIPTSGGSRPGPIGQETTRETLTPPNAPVHMVCDKAQIDANVETLQIVNGVMENPTGPWIVSWYEQSSTLGMTGNVVMAGHVDYWNVGPSVFYHLKDLQKGDTITLIGEDKTPWTYAVDWIETFTLDALKGGKLQEVVAPTQQPSLTLITCGGEFDYVNGEYLSRTVLRATLAPDQSTPAA